MVRATVILLLCIERGKPCELITWHQSYGLCRLFAERLRASGFRPDIIVAIGHGGWVIGRILADFLNLMDLTSFKIEHYHGPHKQARAKVKYPLSTHVSGRRVLLVDDVSDSGDTFEIALEHLRTRGAPAIVRTAVIHHKIQSLFMPISMPDFHARFPCPISMPARL
ncbi:phosphoribosyltransferase [endosymbiont of Tevnia jerichonana]|uniref:phosphoribosyltransferase n=1 Tax=endosymbiont of Tevnia jerichonana TaxID=94785 RepID=UPI0006809B55|nr:phosphoribosyltransferase [endosymbiont of Tevnia jerichonana]